MNHGWPILTDPKKERMALSFFSGTLESGQMMALGSIILAGNAFISAFKAVDFSLLVGRNSIPPAWRIIKKILFCLA